MEDLDFYHNLTEGRTVTSIFFGGGTPSLMRPESVEKIIGRIVTNWKIDKKVEITLEANPNSLKAKDLKLAGVNRLSLGVQSLNGDNLRFLGRIHDRKQALEAIDEVLKTFSNHSMDLIYALPNQTKNQWKKELTEAAAFGFEHLSLYQLTIDEGTPFAKQGVEPMEENQAARLFRFTERFLKTQGYGHYEISNFARPEFESIHNLACWQGWDYLGIGPAAHGRICHSERRRAFRAKREISETSDESRSNESAIFATEHRRKLIPLSPRDRATELLLMGLRLKTGISKANFQTQCGLEFDSFINQQSKQTLIDLRLLADTKRSLRATAKGLLVLDRIIEELVE